MNALAKLAVVLLTTAVGGCSQLSAFNSRPEGPGSLASEALERPTPMVVRQQLRVAQPRPEPFEIDAPLAYTDIWSRLRAGYALGEGKPEGIAPELGFYVKNRDFVRRALDRGKPYLHHIAEQLERRSMPMELALLPVVESAFQPAAYSPSRAAGLWQFIPATGKRFGLTQNRRYDGRRDVLAATDAALEYLSQLNQRFDGDWLLAIAAYNCGERNVERAVEANRAAGKPTDFWSLQLPRETRAYVPRLLAVARMVASPDDFQLELPDIRNEPYFAAVEIGRDVRLADVARQLGIDKTEIERLNPGYRLGVTGSGSHTVAVPVQHLAALLNGLDALPVARSSPEPASTTEPDAWRRYRIRQGDTLGAIAARFGTSVETLRQANGLSGNAIRAGHQLKVPASDRDAQRTAGTGFPGGKRGRPDEARTHTVSRGDTLWHVSRRYRVSVDDLVAMNGLPKAAVLSPGQQLVVGKQSADGSTPNPASAASGKSPRNGTQAAEREKTAKQMTPQASADYQVRKGDSLWSIAQRFGVAVDTLCRLNGINSRTRLKVGQTLIVRAEDAAGT
jgi:membrane-bound lytic murein transglycosylase D